jgi:5'-methylthioadenosine phosphorylase
MMADVADIGVFGGSGLYRLLDDTHETAVETPYGATSAPITIGSVGAHRVAFLPRHGLQHELPPHRVTYRANVWAMRELGVRALLAPCASGSLRREIAPGDFVVIDQLVDRTWGRADTYYEGGEPNHLAFADPYDEGLRALCLQACRDEGVTVHDGGTVVVVQGPRFSTRAESRWYRDAGWHVINMTQYPEAALAAEAGIPYAAIALITDYDTGVEGNAGDQAVTQDEVFAMLERNAAVVRRVLMRAIEAVP